MLKALELKCEWGRGIGEGGRRKPWCIHRLIRTPGGGEIVSCRPQPNAASGLTGHPSKAITASL